jgi:hypothetical protein
MISMVDRKPTVLIFLLDIFSVRNFLFTPLWEYLKATKHADFVIISNSVSHGEFIRKEKVDHVRWEILGNFQDSGKKVTKLSKEPSAFPLSVYNVSRKLGYLSYNILSKIHERIIFRFNHIKGFRTHQLKLNLPAKDRYKEFGELEYQGWPFPGSQVLFDILFKIYTWRGWKSPDWLLRLLDRYRAELAVIAFPQNAMGFTVNRELQKRRIRTIAYINSWDQPTTKGPLPPGIFRFMVWNNQMRNELIKYHDIVDTNIEVVGAAQLDLYRDRSLQMSRSEFFGKVGIRPSRKLVVYGTYNVRLGPHEPEIAAYLAEKVASDAYKVPAFLWIRCHPHDTEWKDRFGNLRGNKNVYVQRGSNFGDQEGGGNSGSQAADDLTVLLNLMAHADIVINSGSTLTLDAIAFDTPVINIAFDGRKEFTSDKTITYRYKYDHFSPIVQRKGSKLVRSYEELDSAISEYFGDRSLDSAGREAIRREQLEPFDGLSCKRIYRGIISCVANG